MFGAVTAFEIRQQWRSPVFWISCAIFFLFAFGAVTTDQIRIGAPGNVNINAPTAIVETLGVMGVMGLFAAIAFVAGAVIRDDETGFAPILRATRLSKPAYVFGRFVGAVTVAWLVIASVALGMLAGTFMPWVDGAKLGPLVISHYLWALVVYVLPGLIVMSAAFFALATATRSMMWTYVGAVAFLVLFIASRALRHRRRADRSLRAVAAAHRHQVLDRSRAQHAAARPGGPAARQPCAVAGGGGRLDGAGLQDVPHGRASGARAARPTGRRSRAGRRAG
jgi:ABC-2 type transport system permease protein